MNRLIAVEGLGLGFGRQTSDLWVICPQRVVQDPTSVLLLFFLVLGLSGTSGLRRPRCAIGCGRKDNCSRLFTVNRMQTLNPKP